MTTTELATKAQEAGLAVATGQHRVNGLENIDDKELPIGSLILVQPGHLEIVQKGVPAGSIYHTSAEARVEDATFIPAYMTKFWSLYDNSGPKPKWVLSSPNENDPRFKGKLRQDDITPEMRKQKIKPEVLPVIGVVAVFAGEPAKINFIRTSGYYAGKDLYGLICRAGGNAWDNKYRLLSKLMPAKGENPAYFALKVEKVGATTDDERKFAEQINVAFKSKPDVAEEVPF